MLLGGLWHGANWTFVVWGAIQGGYLVAERVDQGAVGAARAARPAAVRWCRSLQWVLTFNLICFAWVFFRAPSLAERASTCSASCSRGGASALVTPLLIVTIVAMLASQFVPPRVPRAGRGRFARLAPVLQIGALAVGLVLVDALGPEGIAPFIYFQF